MSFFTPRETRCILQHRRYRWGDHQLFLCPCTSELNMDTSLAPYKPRSDMQLKGRKLGDPCLEIKWPTHQICLKIKWPTQKHATCNLKVCNLEVHIRSRFRWIWASYKTPLPIGPWFISDVNKILDHLPGFCGMPNPRVLLQFPKGSIVSEQSNREFHCRFYRGMS